MTTTIFESPASIAEMDQLVHMPRTQRTLVETLGNPDLTLARAVATYILYKRRRLTEASERSYTAILNELTKHHPGARLHDFEPPRGTITVEEFLTARWGHLAERTFDRDKRRLVIFTKGEKIHTLPIVEDVIWELLEQLNEPPHHYLLPKTVTRKRTPPTRPHLNRLAAALTDARNALDAATADTQIHREATALLNTLGLADRQFALAHAAASVRTTPTLDQPMGEHGTHLWWYRCLTRAGVVPAGTTKGRKLHSARHTAIQAVLERTGNLKAAQAVAGHANVATTGDVYTGWEVEQTAVTLRQTILP